MKTLKRRRKSNQTDYMKRLKLLKSSKPRIVFRKTNKYVIAQYITSNETLDKIEIGTNSKQLLKYGWSEKFKGSLKSIPASYLTGLLLGKKILKEKKEHPILDFGMIKGIHGTKIFAFMKGVIDAGIKLKHSKEIFPSEDKIAGKNLKDDFSKDFEKIKSKIENEK